MNRRSLLKLGAAAIAPIAKPAPPAKSGVKITDVKTYRMPWNSLFVRILTDEGTWGIGECSPMNCIVEETIIQKVLKSDLIGKDPFDAGPLNERMLYRHFKLGPGGALTCSIAGVDLALWDLKGKLLGLPVVKLLGGPYRSRVPVYFSYPWDRKSSPKDVAALIKKQIDAGYHATKLRMTGPGGVLTDTFGDAPLRYLTAIRQAVGDKVRLMVDGNNGYTTHAAIEMGRRLKQEVNLAHFEEPTAQYDYAAMAQVQAALPDLQVAAGEHEFTLPQFRDLITQGNPGAVQPDVTKCGITVMSKAAVLAEAYNKPIVAHNTLPTLGTAATIHVAASIPNGSYPQEYPGPSRKEVSLFKNQLEFRDGELVVPMSPGLGLDVDLSALEAAAERAS